MNTALIEAAKNYLSLDFSVVPVGQNKRPTVKWEVFQSRPADINECERLFGDVWGLAIIGGNVSDGIEFIDFDSHGKDIVPIFQSFMSDTKVIQLFSKHAIYVEMTKSGGYHVVYKYECDGKRDGSMKLAAWENGESMIETRGEKGYCIVAPVPGYTTIRGNLEELPRLSEFERQYLIDFAKSFTQSKISTSEDSIDTKSKAVHDNTDPVSWFNWNKDSYAKKILEEKGWKKLKYDEKEELEYWQRPGKDPDDDSWSATWGKKHGALFVFTQSVEYFKHKAYYTPFQILVRLKFNNDYNAALKWVVSKYGKHQPVEVVSEPTTDNAISERQFRFPMEVFPQKVQQFVSLLNETMNYSPDFLSVAMMFTVATLNGNKYKLKMKEEWHAPTIFWFAAVGEPGTMKSHPISTILKPIGVIDREVKKLYDLEYAEYERMMVESKEKKLVRKPKFRQMKITDITLESLHEVHSINKRGLGYYRDELVGFLKDMNKYRGGSDEQFWLESFNNGSYIVNRVSKQANLIEDTNINIIGTIQPSVLSKITKDHDGNGLTDRFLYTYSEENIYPLNRKDIDPKWIQWWHGSIINANKWFDYIDKSDTVVLTMSDEAADKLVEIDILRCAKQRSEDISDSLKNYLSKAKTYIPRFVLLMALFDTVFDGTELEVTIDHVERAEKIMQYFIESSRAIFDKAENVQEINDVASVKKGVTIQEMILYLNEKGFKNADIAKKVGKSRAYVGKYLKLKTDKNT